MGDIMATRGKLIGLTLICAVGLAFSVPAAQALEGRGSELGGEQQSLPPAIDSRTMPSAPGPRADSSLRSAVNSVAAGIAWLCGSSLLGWNPSINLSDSFKDQGYGAYLITNEFDVEDEFLPGCDFSSNDLTLYSGNSAFSGKVWSRGYWEQGDLSRYFWGNAVIAVRGRLDQLAWTNTPMPRAGQKVFGFSLTAGRPMPSQATVLELQDSFVSDTGTDYCPYGVGACRFHFRMQLSGDSRVTTGSPVVNDQGRVLGTAINSAGPYESVIVRGTPTLCFSTISCYDARTVWLDIAPPSSPTILNVEPRHNAVRVSWATPVDNGGSRITQYIVTSFPGAKTCSAADNACTVTGLNNGDTYTFTVRAENAAGLGSASEPSQLVSPRLEVPQSVAWIRVKERGNKLRISWLPIYVASQGHSPYQWFEYRIGNGAWTKVRNNVVTVGRPTGSKKIAVTVRAANEAGYSRPKKVRVSL